MIHMHIYIIKNIYVHIYIHIQGVTAKKETLPYTTETYSTNPEGREAPRSDPLGPCAVKLHTVEARKLEHGFRRISARIPYTLP